METRESRLLRLRHLFIFLLLPLLLLSLQPASPAPSRVTVRRASASNCQAVTEALGTRSSLSSGVTSTSVWEGNAGARVDRH